MLNDGQLIMRQLKRFNPSQSDLYFDLNRMLSNELELIRPRLIGKRILDIGAGELPFAEFFIGLSVETCDIQQNSVGTIDHVIEAGAPLPFQDGSFDVICIFDVLEHVQNDVAFIGECSRILDVGGVILCSVPFMYRFHEEPDDYRRYTPSGLRYLFETVGKIGIESIKGIGSPFFCASIILRERKTEVTFFRKFIYKLFSKMLWIFRCKNEVSQLAPFAYFLIAVK
jgi:SAM-dependent methyltransferase